jgi:hypothetical protein
MQFWALVAIAIGLHAIVESPTMNLAQSSPIRDENLRQELLQRMAKDQDARKPIAALLAKAKGNDPDEIKTMDAPAVKRMNVIDRENTQRIREIVKQFGWPGKSLVGADGAHAAWILVQHADHDRAFQKECLTLIEAALKNGESTGEEFAYLTDRVRIGEKRKQIYGTQIQMLGGKVIPHPIEDEAGVDDRRERVGLPPLAAYLKFSQWVLEYSGGSDARAQ